MKRLPLIFLIAAIAVIIAAAALRRPPATQTPSHPTPTTNTPSADLFHPPHHDHPAIPPDQVKKLPTGRVTITTTEAGKPVAEVPIGLWNEEYHVGLREKTDITGGHTFEKVPIGTWTAAAKHPRYVPAQQQVTVSEGQTTQVVFLLSVGGRLTGTITDESGRPIANAGVSILDVTSKKEMHPSLKARSDPQGAYLIEGIPLGTAGLLVLASRYRPIDRYDLAFRAEGETVRVDITLRAGTVLSGRVVDESGAPVAGALVNATNEHTGMSNSDAEGRFAIYGLGDNPVNLFATKKGYGTLFARGLAAGSTNVELRLPKGAIIIGRVTGAKPGDFFSVLLYRYEEDLGRELLIRTVPVRNSADGSFMIDDVSPGHYWISIDAAGVTVPVRAEIVVHSGETVSVTIEARR